MDLASFVSFVFAFKYLLWDFGLNSFFSLHLHISVYE